MSLGWGSFLGGQYPGQEAVLLLGWLSMPLRQGFLQKRLVVVDSFKTLLTGNIWLSFSALSIGTDRHE